MGDENSPGEHDEHEPLGACQPETSAVVSAQEVGQEARGAVPAEEDGEESAGQPDLLAHEQEQAHEHGEVQELVQRGVVDDVSFKKERAAVQRSVLARDTTEVLRAEEEARAAPQVLPDRVAPDTPDRQARRQGDRERVEQVPAVDVGMGAQPPHGVGQAKDEPSGELEPALPDRDRVEGRPEVVEVGDHISEAGAHESEHDDPESEAVRRVAVETCVQDGEEINAGEHTETHEQAERVEGDRTEVDLRKGLVRDRSEHCAEATRVDLPPEVLPLASNAVLEHDGKRHRISYEVRIPFFGFIFVPLVRQRARKVAEAADAGLPLPSDNPWWAPPVAASEEVRAGIASICLLSVVIGYSGGLLTQTVPYAAKVFDVDDSALGVGLAVVRTGVLLSLLLGAVADRKGRRRFVLAGASVQCLVTALIGLAPLFPFYIGGHITLRCLDTAVGVALGVLAAEIVPAGSRAYMISLVTLSGGVGWAVGALLLPVAALGRGGLSAVYLLALAALPAVRVAGRHLPESTRFERHVREPHGFRQLLHGSERRRLAFVGGATFLGALFGAPASEFGNRYLDKVRGFGPGDIIFLGAIGSLPFIPMLLWGARRADRQGRKVIGVPSLALGSITGALFFLVGSPWIYLVAFIGTGIGAPGAAALGVYGPELFPTRIRSAANTAVLVFGVMGSALGLVVAGQLSDGLGIGRAVASLAVFPLLSALVVGLFFPETARKELEETSHDAV